MTLLLPDLLFGDYPSVRRRVSAALRSFQKTLTLDLGSVRPLAFSETIQVDAELMRRTSAPYFYPSMIPLVAQRWSLDRPDLAQCLGRILLESEWGGLALLSQDAGGILIEPLFGEYMRWVSTHLDLLETLIHSQQLRSLDEPYDFFREPSWFTATLGDCGVEEVEIRRSLSKQGFGEMIRRHWRPEWGPMP